MTAETREKTDALIIARTFETKTGKRHYVRPCPESGWEVTDRMPLLGEWYDADGIRHG